MKKYSVIFLMVLFAGTAFGQKTKGLKMPEPKAPTEVKGKTYALIVGISKYKDPGLPSLQFADKDAYAFYEYLKAEGVDTANENIKVLLNDKATLAEFWADLGYITELARAGDKVYFYFSGHGDVESKTIVANAYLLPYDAPTVNYASGAIGIRDLKDYIATMSAHGAQVVFIVDACRAGNLAGGKEGMEATANVLQGKWKDAVKILSCRAGETSLEGAQWGGGRGLFSYELINGLAGKADKNKDGKVNLHELNLYLTEKVPEGAEPAHQNPMLEEGDPDMILSTVNEKTLSAINNITSSNILSVVDMRGFDEILLKNVNATVKSNYYAFKACLDTGNYAKYPDEQLSRYSFGQPTENLKVLPSALYYLKQIPVNDSTSSLLAYMRRNLSASLMGELTDTSQKAIKKAEQTLKGQSSKLITNNIHNWLKDITLKTVALQQLLGTEKLKKLGFYSKAISSEVYFGFMDTIADLGKALVLLDSAISTDPNNGFLYFLKGFVMGEKDTANFSAPIIAFKKAVELTPKLSMIYPIIAMCFKELKQMDSVAYYLRKGMENTTGDPFSTRFTYLFALAEMKMTDSVKANLETIENYIPKEKILISTLQLYYFQFGMIALELKLADKAIYFANKINDSDSSIFSIKKYMIITDAYCILDDKTNALKNFKSALERGYDNYERILQIPYLDKIRHEPEFKALMKKYFPKQYKG